jgi:ribonuclease D
VTQTIPPATYIDNGAALRALVESLRLEPILAVDTESNNMHAYQGRVCLVQLSTMTQDYIIDPLLMENDDAMQSLGELLADKRIEKIFHAAEYDLICLKRDFGFEVCNLFDTMYAAKLAELDSVGLADLLQQFLGVEVDKSHQLDDWGKRPLPKDSLRYAQQDTHYLPTLRDILLNHLLEMNRVPEAQEVFEDVLRVDVPDTTFDPDGFWKLGLPRSLNRRQMACLRELYLLRDELARQEDVPVYQLFSNKALVWLSRKQPRNYTELGRARYLSARSIRVYGDLLLDAISAGRRVKNMPAPPERDLPDPDVADRYTAFHAWRKERGEQRNLESNLVVSRQTLWELARVMPRTKAELAEIDGFGPWRIDRYGDDILELVARLS